MSLLSVDGTNDFSKRQALLTLAHGLGSFGYVSVLAMGPIFWTDFDLNAG